MTLPPKDYQVLPFPANRQVIVDAGRLAARRHIIHALLELDVTPARQLIHAHKERHSETLSFTGFIIACLAQAVNDYPLVQAYRNWRNQLVVFSDVDVVTLIETEVNGVALPHILRAANRKSYRQIHDEIRAVQALPGRSAQHGGLIDLAPRLPRFVRDLFYWAIRQNPHWFRQISGTVIVTAVGAFGHSAGWGLAFLPYHTLGLTIGGIGEKPGVVDGRVEIREYLSLTISYDHDVVDGAPASRFARRLKELVENAELFVT
jgi:pyruvate/2-oxoglutarate dehydrogenase complex dihydrolipoamide acyltransferase (E2) component